jgi:hypothetical protein
MEAKLFFLKSQERLLNDIEPLLREHIYRDLLIQRHPISHKYSQKSAAEEHRAFKDYLYLLKASMVKVDDFKINVEDDEGNWTYVYTDYEAKYYLSLVRSSLSSIFPAIAIMDRMVLAPQGIHSAFAPSREFSFLAKPLNLQGMLLVNFQDVDAISECIQKIGAQLKSEIVQLCRQHMFINGILQPDLDGLASLLKIDKRYLKQYQPQISKLPVKLVPLIVSGPAPLEKESLVVLEIHNESEEVIGKVRVEVRSPKETLTDSTETLKNSVAKYLDFSVGKPRIQKIQFKVHPHTIPYCSLEVMFILDEASLSYTPFPIPLTLDVNK